MRRARRREAFLPALIAPITLLISLTPVALTLAATGAGPDRFLDAPQYATNGFVNDLAVADFINDGIADAATTGTANSRDTVSVLLRTVGDRPIQVLTAAMNGDRAPDLVVATATSSSVSALLNTGDS